MKFQNVLSFCVMATIAVTAWGGVEHGNGGGAVVCRDSSHNITSIEVLDFYEQRILLHLKRDMGPNNLNWTEKAHYVLERRKSIAPFRTSYWGNQVDQFEREALFLQGVVFDKLHDTGNIYIPVGCAFEQVIVQQTPTLPRDMRYKVNKDLWDLMDEENRAGLVLHEVIYREAITYGHEDSISSRYLNGLWTSAEVIKEFTSLKQLNDLLRDAHFAAGEGFGCNPWLFAAIQDVNGKLTPQWNQPLQLAYHDNEMIKTIGPSVVQSTGMFNTPFGQISANCVTHGERVANIDEQGNLTYILWVKDGYLNSKQFAVNVSNRFGWNYRVENDEYLINVQSGEINVQNQRISIDNNSGTDGRLTLRTYDRSISNLAAWTSAFKLRGVNGKWFSRPARGGSQLNLSSDGLVLSCDGCIQTSD